MNGTGTRETPDTSVLVPAFVRWHEHHEPARDAVAGCSALVAHVAVETYSVLTRLPSGRHLAGAAVTQLLDRQFADPWLVPDPAHLPELLRRCAAAGLRGGAVYDALVGATAAGHGFRLVSLDGRAGPTYHAVGADMRML